MEQKTQVFCQINVQEFHLCGTNSQSFDFSDAIRKLKVKISILPCIKTLSSAFEQ
jgi:hypothetical protein